MRYAHDNSLSIAASVVRERVRSLPEFAEARALVLRRCVERLQKTDMTPDTLRALGGLSEVIRSALLDLDAKFYVDVGSKMFPKTVAEELAWDVEKMRFELQRVFAHSKS